MTLIGATLALLFLEPPFSWLVIGFLVLIDLAQIAVWLRWRNRRSITGSDGMLGQRGIVVTDLAPEGQVKAKGQIWKARSTTPLVIGTPVEVVEVHGIELSVVPVVTSNP